MGMLGGADWAVIGFYFAILGVVVWVAAHQQETSTDYFLAGRNGGSWESMHFTPQSQSAFIEHHLGPALKDSGHGDIKPLIYDQNRDDLESWTDVMFGDPETAAFVHGPAVHWYSSTFKVCKDVFDRVDRKLPTFSIIHTEATIDSLGNDAPRGVLDPARFKESNWFDSDAFWWNANATDWA